MLPGYMSLTTASRYVLPVSSWMTPQNISSTKWLWWVSLKFTYSFLVKQTSNFTRFWADCHTIQQYQSVRIVLWRTRSFTNKIDHQPERTTNLLPLTNGHCARLSSFNGVVCPHRIDSVNDTIIAIVLLFVAYYESKCNAVDLL